MQMSVTMKLVCLLGTCLTIIFLRKAECYGVTLPHTVLSKTDFDNKIVGKIMTHYYTYDQGYAWHMPLHAKIRFRIADPIANKYSLSLVGRDPNDFSNGTCYASRFYNLSLDSETYAIMTNDQVPLTQFYLSSYPDEYLITFGCQYPDHAAQICTGMYTVILSGANDSPDGFRWTDVDFDLKTNLNLRLRDPRFKFDRKLIACPNDPPY